MKRRGRGYPPSEVAAAFAELPSALEEAITTRAACYDAETAVAVARLALETASHGYPELRRHSAAATESYRSTLQAAERSGLARSMRHRIEQLRIRSEELARECAEADARLDPLRRALRAQEARLTACRATETDHRERIAALTWIVAEPSRVKEERLARDARDQRVAAARARTETAKGERRRREEGEVRDAARHTQTTNWSDENERRMRRMRPWV